jgi:tetratricopeptide (TPR) repeat protein
VEALQRAVDADPANLVAWDNLAKLSLVSGQIAEAERAWRAALAIDGGDGHAARLTSLGSVVAAQGRTSEAIALFRRALDRDPQSPRAWTQLGVVLFARHDFGSAVDALRQALALDPDNLSARRHLFLTWLARGRRDDAERELEHVLRIAPQHVESIVDMAILHLNRGEFDAALARLDAALTVDDNHGRARYYRGLTLEQLGRHDEARDALEPLSQGTDKYARKASRHLQR